MTSKSRVLIVEDDVEMRRFLEEELSEAGHEVLSAAGGAAALERLSRSDVDVVVTDFVMPGMKGESLLSEFRARDPGLPIVIITAFGSIEAAVEAIKRGAYHYVAKPFRIEQLLLTLEGALRERRLRRQVEQLRSGAGVEGIVAASPSMRKTMDLVRRAAASDASVLIVGESGTGKELLARELHAAGPRAERPFLAVNCSAIPETLLESTLFGHRRGAFTDAREDRRGLFQEAGGGTILLDEIGDMPPALQGKMLRVLQEREVHPLGAPAPVRVDVRVVAATHRDLQALIERGAFRQDLYYRLNVITVTVPPLRDRREDILPLVAHFLHKHAPRLGRSACSISQEALDQLHLHSWPGNVRELENAVERALVLARDDVIWAEDLPDAVRNRTPAAAGWPAAMSLSDVEREHIIGVLRTVKGNKAAAARLLGLDRKTLYRKLELYSIHD